MRTLILVLAVAIITLLVWKLWKPSPKRVVPANEANLYFFYTDWCGFSQKAMPEWEKLEKVLETTPYFGNTHVKAVRVNADEDQATTSLYEVDGYPTVLLETSDSLSQFQGRRTQEHLLQFLRSALGKERESL